MALTSTSKQISSLKINKVPSEAIYAKMVAKNLINDDELYLISGEVDAITGVKGNKETTYRTGNINLTPADIGALPDTTEIPVVPTNISAFENDAGYLTQHQSLTNYPKKTELATVATSGSYNDLKNKPTIPSVGNGTLTIQKNGTSAGTFTANDTTDKTINIIVPTKVSELTDDVVKGKYLPLVGGTMTGKLTVPHVETGDGNSNFFQCIKFRGEGNADTYYHAIDFGYKNHDQVDFHEYGGKWNFYKNQSGKVNEGVLCGSITSNGWEGRAKLKSGSTMVTSQLTENSDAIATTAFVHGLVDNVKHYSASNPPPYPVTSVNSKSGAVTLSKGDVGLGNVDNVKQYSASNPPPYPVTSVNGHTGAITVHEVPSVTTSDNGKFMRVVNGAWTATTAPNRFTFTATANQSTFTIPFDFEDSSALTVYYNGIMMKETDNYTVSGKDITLVGFTAEAGDYLTVMGIEGAAAIDFAQEATDAIAQMNTAKSETITAINNIKSQASTEINTVKSNAITEINNLVATLPSDTSSIMFLNQTNTMTANGKITMDSTYTPSANGDVATKQYVDNHVPDIDPPVGTSTNYAIYIGSTAPASGTTPLLWIDTTASTGTFKYRTSTTGTWTPVPVAYT